MTTRAAAQRWAVALCAGLLSPPSTRLPAQQASPDRHVISAARLVDQLDLDDTDHGHGQGSVTRSGTVASHTDCSGFIDHLLMHDGLA